MFINTFCWAQDLPKSGSKLPAEQKPETKLNKKTEPKTAKKEVIVTENDSITSIVSDSIIPKKKFLEDIVSYKAKDYVAFKRKEQKLYLYNEAEVKYQDMDISAGVIVIDYSKNEVYAGRLKDSTGNYTQNPVFKQGTNTVEPDSIRFNFKTKKALIFNSRTEQNGGTIIADRTKKENDSVYFLSRGKYTTSKNLDDPEYYFLLRNAKLVPGSKVVTGLTNLFIYDVPTPIGIPFAFFPLEAKQTSGVIFPSFGEETQRGYFLQNGGYYFAINDYFDLAVLGDYYTNGSYGIRFESKYAKKYNYNGSASFRYENNLNSERGFSDFSRSTIYNIRWTHSRDAKANPNSRFSASVNLGSSNYYQSSVNQVNISNRLNNTLSSSVSYSKTFQGEPQVNVTVAATHSQNTQTQTINMTLPTFTANVSSIYPFAPKNGIKKGLIKNINFQYSVRGENSFVTTDSLFFTKQMFDDAKTGLRHSIPLTTNFKIFNYFSVSTSANYNETWTLNTIKKEFDTETNSVITSDVKGFDSFRTYNFGASLGTTLYGLFNFDKKNKGKKIQQIRHVIRPSLNYSINPAFDKFYETVEVIDADGTTASELEFTRFEGNNFGSPNRNFSSSIGLSISNNFEAKVRDRDSTATEPKKIVLLNNLNFSTSYNLAGDSLKLSPVSFNGGTQFFDNKLSVNFAGTLDPYALDNNLRRIDKFNIDNGGSLFRLTNATLNMRYSLNSESFGKGKTKTSKSSREETLQGGGRDDDLFGRSQDFSDQRFAEDNKDKEDKPSELYNYKVPWSLNLAYALNYNNRRLENEISSHSLMFSGDMEIAPRWTIGVSSGYDMKNQGFTPTQLRFARDLLSWNMNFSMYLPSRSNNTTWNFFIGIKSSLLKDLKYEKRKRPDVQL